MQIVWSHALRSLAPCEVLDFWSLPCAHLAVIHVDLQELERGVLVTELLELRADHLARAAPLRLKMRDTDLGKTSPSSGACNALSGANVAM